MGLAPGWLRAPPNHHLLLVNSRGGIFLGAKCYAAEKVRHHYKCFAFHSKALENPSVNRGKIYLLNVCIMLLGVRL
jgi:hypothetical protein